MACSASRLTRRSTPTQMIPDIDPTHRARVLSSGAAPSSVDRTSPSRRTTDDGPSKGRTGRDRVMRTDRSAAKVVVMTMMSDATLDRPSESHTRSVVAARWPAHVTWSER
jgi:hypothetical protein